LTATQPVSILPLIMPETHIRAFIAIVLPEPIQQGLERLIQQLNAIRITGVRWIPPQNIHLTLKFLGETARSDLKTLEALLNHSVKNFTPFDITLSGVGAFPNPRRARIVWAGVQSPPELSQLQKNIESQTTVIGIPSEERPFSPHLTFGRVNKNITPPELAALAAALSKINPHEVGRFTVDHFTLYRSDLRSAGAVYTPLARFVFSG
jgi:RNA 2',3'-cyclic 3'-phosphodiesterase